MPTVFIRATRSLFGTCKQASSLQLPTTTTIAAGCQRTFATSLHVGIKAEWLAIIPDKPNVLDIRKSVKAQHYEGIQPLIAAGKLTAGGATFDKHPVDGEAAPFTGSVVVYASESVEEVRRIIEEDIYAKSGVWDLEKVKIVPYVPAVREPLNKA